MTEKELLEMLKENTNKSYEELIAENRDWKVLYHLSGMRENILAWLPLTKEDSVLEVGAECGALTGILARKAGQVVSMEESKEKAEVCRYRYSSLDNITFLVGKFSELLEQITQQFDYITLIGGLAYAQHWQKGEYPYVKLLQKLAGYLKPKGRLILAIENRLGLKYWAGCMEEHTGYYFEGIEGYKETTGVRTFSKKELEEILVQADIGEYKFYYPYPDYEFTDNIYSDSFLPKCGELKNNSGNIEAERMLLFNDSRVFDEIICNGLFPIYSNAFLVEIEKR